MENMGVDGRVNINVHLIRMSVEDMGWINLTQDRMKWRTVLNKVINVQVT